MRGAALGLAGAVGALGIPPPPAVEISEGGYQGRPQFVVKASGATWFYDRAGGGFSRLVDADGRDWIAFDRTPLQEFPASAAAGYRGLPNLVFGADNPDAGAGHPGFDRCSSRRVDERSIRTVSRSGRWAWSWSWSPDGATATMTVERADPEHGWWFLYEGPVAGSFDPSRKLWGSDRGGPRSDIPDIESQHFDRFRWVYFADRDVPRALFLAQHEADDLDDTLWYLGSSHGGAASAPDGMVVFGFGRGPGTEPLFRGASQRFTVGLLELDRPAADSHDAIAEAVRQALSGRPREEVDRASTRHPARSSRRRSAL